MLSRFAAHEILQVEEVPYSGPVWNLTVENSPTFQTRIGMSHNTVKPVRLLRYLARLVTPPGGLLVDAFCGSGSCGIAAGLEGFDYIGIELDPEGKGFVDIARARIRHHVGESVKVDPCPSCGSVQVEEWGESGEFWRHCHGCGKDSELGAKPRPEPKAMFGGFD